MPYYCDISDRAQMSKTIIAVKHFALGSRELLETAVISALTLQARNRTFGFDKDLAFLKNLIIQRTHLNTIYPYIIIYPDMQIRK